MLEIGKKERRYRKISAKKLPEIFSEHMEWLLSQGVQGRQACLSFSDLEGVDLSREYLKDAIFREANLENADLSYTNLEEADLRGANLSGAYIWKTNFKGSNLWLTNLEGVSFLNANLEDVIFLEAHLEKTDFTEAHFLRANLRRVNFEGANLSGANLKEADLGEANLSGASFENANLQKAALWDANLNGAELNWANLKEAVLVNADLGGANLIGADLTGADLCEANLKGADLNQANLSEANVTSIKYDRKSKYHRKYAGIRVATCYGSPLFKRDAEDLAWLNEYLEKVEGSKKRRRETFKEAKAYYRRIPLAKKIKNISKLDPIWLLFHIYFGWLWSRLKRESLENIPEIKRSDTVKKLFIDQWKIMWAKIWGFTSDYGRSFFRWALVSIYIAFLFGCFYTALPNAFEVPKLHDPYFHSGFETTFELLQETIRGLGTMIYYSVVTFTTLGFGDVVPKNLFAAAVVMLEVIIGYIMLGGLISIFANILARRS